MRTKLSMGRSLLHLALLVGLLLASAGCGSLFSSKKEAYPNLPPRPMPSAEQAEAVRQLADACAKAWTALSASAEMASSSGRDLWNSTMLWTPEVLSFYQRASSQVASHVGAPADPLAVDASGQSVPIGLSLAADVYSDEAPKHAEAEHEYEKGVEEFRSEPHAVKSSVDIPFVTKGFPGLIVVLVVVIIGLTALGVPVIGIITKMLLTARKTVKQVVGAIDEYRNSEGRDAKPVGWSGLKPILKASLNDGGPSKLVDKFRQPRNGG